MGLLWILSFPYAAKDVFTSENALRGDYLESQFKKDPRINKIFDTFRDQVEALQSPQEIKNYIQKQMQLRSETHTQKLNSIDGGLNIYSYFRTKDGPGKECNALAVPLSYKPGLVYLLTFVEMMYQIEPKWQSKDLLILFYEDSDYSFAVEEFL